MVAKDDPVERWFRNSVTVILVGMLYLSFLTLSSVMIYLFGVTHKSNAFVDEIVDVYTNRSIEKNLASSLVHDGR